MSRGSRVRWDRLALICLAALVGAGVGSVIGVLPEARYAATKFADATPALAERVPLPHHVPEYPGGASLRFAMVQDVIHERFARHPREFYAARNRLVETQLLTLSASDPTRFSLTDDLGVGRERLGESGAAVELLRAKLAEQERLGLQGRDLYTTYANIGTFLIHANLGPTTRGDPAARERFVEGIECIRRAVELNPEAHFGRERWQVAIAEFLLAAMGDPTLLRTWDFLGNRLDLPIESILERGTHWGKNGGYGRPTTPDFSRWQVHEPALFFEPRVNLADPTLWPTLRPIRVAITRVGAEAGWADLAVTTHRSPVPFDEPTLGIIGMWRQGGGANPHFALALGETMLRVGQRRLAWAAFERTTRLAERFSFDPALRLFLVEHCRARQSAIEATLAFLPPSDRSAASTPRQLVSPHRADDQPNLLRARFDAELQFGEEYQRRYQEFESDRLALGIRVDDPQLDAGFPAGPVPIASPVGPEEWFVGVSPAQMRAYTIRHSRATALCGAGAGAMIAALGFRIRPRLRPEVRSCSAADPVTSG